MKNKLMQILKEGSGIATATVKRDLQRGKVTDLDERLANYMILRDSSLYFSFEKFKNQSIHGHVKLVKGERSGLAQLAADLL